MGEPKRAGAPARRIADLERGERRRALALTFALIAAAWVVLIGLFYILPAGPDSAAWDAIRLVIGLVLFALIIVWQASHVG